jgi:predicted nucleic acid-binding protein
MTLAIIDSGVLIAAADADDRYHERCARVLRTRELDFVIPALCVAEACHFIGKRAGAEAESTFLRNVGRVPVLAPEPNEWVPIADLVQQYGGLKIGGVDASIVLLAERLNTDLIATLDHRHFRAIKPRHCEFFRLLPEL